jgi:hypothetical protein
MKFSSYRDRNVFGSTSNVVDTVFKLQYYKVYNHDAELIILRILRGLEDNDVYLFD